MTHSARPGPRRRPDPDPVPPLQRPEEAPPVRNDEDVRRRWRSLLGDGGFQRTTLWIVWYDADGRQLPVVVPIDDLPQALEPAALQNLMIILAEPGSMGAASVALALSRPGPGSVTATDRQRANAILAAVDRARRQKAFDLRVWPIHLATANSVRVLSVDDLV
jgi:hypothetical protein